MTPPWIVGNETQSYAQKVRQDALFFSRDGKECFRSYIYDLVLLLPFDILSSKKTDILDFKNSEYCNGDFGGGGLQKITGRSNETTNTTTLRHWLIPSHNNLNHEDLQYSLLCVTGIMHAQHLWGFGSRWKWEKEIDQSSTWYHNPR